MAPGSPQWRTERGLPEAMLRVSRSWKLGIIALAQKPREHLASLLERFRSLSIRKVPETTFAPEDEDWAFTSSDELKVSPVRLAEPGKRARVQVVQGPRAHEIIAATAAVLGFCTPASLGWLAKQMRASSDPRMPPLAGCLEKMLEQDNEGKRRVDARLLQTACLIHAEILAMRAEGIVSEQESRVQAAEIVRARLKAGNPGRRVISGKRLLAIYRENEVRVLEIWPLIEHFGPSG